MSERDEGSDSDAPEEFTSEQGQQQDVEIRKAQRENKSRVAREGKERRRKRAQQNTPKQRRSDESIQDFAKTETHEESNYNRGMLPNEIVKLLAAREKQVFASDSEEEKEEKTMKKRSSKKKRPKNFGMEPIILKEIPPPPCVQNSLDFLKKRKMQVSRSSAVLDNSNQALRLLSASGLLTKK